MGPVLAGCGHFDLVLPGVTSFGLFDVVVPVLAGNYMAFDLVVAVYATLNLINLVDQRITPLPKSPP